MTLPCVGIHGRCQRKQGGEGGGVSAQAGRGVGVSASREGREGLGCQRKLGGGGEEMLASTVWWQRSVA